MTKSTHCFPRIACSLPCSCVSFLGHSFAHRHALLTPQKSSAPPNTSSSANVRTPLLAHKGKRPADDDNTTATSTTGGPVGASSKSLTSPPSAAPSLSEGCCATCVIL